MYRIPLTKRALFTQKSIATIGNFDGLHLGHLKLLQSLDKFALSNKLHRILITFEPSPTDYFADIATKPRTPRLSLLRDKVEILKHSGLVDEVVLIRFNTSIANLSPSTFVEEVLKDRLSVSHMVIGHDFRFGKNAQGGATDLERAGIITHELDSFQVNDNRVSSSLLRKLAIVNDFSQIKTYLGRNLRYTARIIYGNQLGRKFGVPTINLSMGKNKPVLWGVYMVFVYIDGVKYNAIASIGKNPTVSNQDTYKLEAHLLDIDLNLYGKIATIEILSFVREERKFDDLDSLFKQIHLDIDMARKYFGLSIHKDRIRHDKV